MAVCIIVWCCLAGFSGGAKKGRKSARIAIFSFLLKSLDIGVKHVKFSLLVPEAANDAAFDFSSSAGYARCRVDFSVPKACIVTPITARYGDVHVIFG